MIPEKNVEEVKKKEKRVGEKTNEPEDVRRHEDLLRPKKMGKPEEKKE
ncbi:MAG: hypothetical protein SA339_04225 [Methanomassiliicoccus sp.]|nr:hypothetical protein [Methanomassiliicoccus sp.]